MLPHEEIFKKVKTSIREGQKELKNKEVPHFIFKEMKELEKDCDNRIEKIKKTLDKKD